MLLSDLSSPNLAGLVASSNLSLASIEEAKNASQVSLDSYAADGTLRLEGQLGSSKNLASLQRSGSGSSAKHQVRFNLGEADQTSRSSLKVPVAARVSSPLTQVNEELGDSEAINTLSTSRIPAESSPASFFDDLSPKSTPEPMCDDDMTDGTSNAVMRSRRASSVTKKPISEKLARLRVFEFLQMGTSAVIDIFRADLFAYTRQSIATHVHSVARNVPQLTSRDIRKLDYGYTAVAEPTIIVREQVILVNIDPLRAIILKDRCITVTPTDDEDDILALVDHAYSVRKPAIVSRRIPFEFEALDIVITVVLDLLTEQANDLSDRVNAVLERLGRKSVSQVLLENLRALKFEASSLTAKIAGVHRAVTAVLEEDQDMFFMQLTKLSDQPDLLSMPNYEDHDETEVLFETFLQDISFTKRQATLLTKRIEDTERLLQLKLNTSSNRLLTADLAQNWLVVGVNIISATATLFGMNLASGLEEREGWFIGMIFVTMSACTLLFIFGMFVARRRGLLFS